jgi:transposase
MLDGILSILRTGAPWRDLLRERFGPSKKVYDYFSNSRKRGVFDRVLERLTTVEEPERDERCPLNGTGLPARSSKLISQTA